MKDYYELLEVSQNASDEVIARAYKVLAKKYHPDMNPDNKEEADNKLKHSVEFDSWVYERTIREWKSVFIDRENY